MLLDPDTDLCTDTGESGDLSLISLLSFADGDPPALEDSSTGDLRHKFSGLAEIGLSKLRRG